MGASGKVEPTARSLDKSVTKTEPSPHIKPEPPVNTVSPELRQRAEDYVAKYGALYAPIRHPDLADLPSTHGPERFDIIRPHIPADARTALDIGAHWGFFSGLFEESGLKVTAVESDPNSIWFIKEIAKASGKQFDVIEGSVLDAQLGQYDIVIALNIFHHFLKKKPIFEKFKTFLNKLDCKTMFFQAHHTTEGQMRGAYRNFEPEEFCDFLVANTRLSTWKEIGAIGTRKIFKIT